jgi:DNA-binding MarR family transcriptional regulator
LQPIEQALTATHQPLTQKKIRDIVRLRTSDVSQALAPLVANGRVIKSADGYQLSPSP